MRFSRWKKLSLIEQMANIGSEVYRTIKWRDKNKKFFISAFERALELFDLTLMDKKNRKRLKEVARAREVFCDYIVGDNLYGFTDKAWEKYFYHFNYASRL